ncbi:hypothetical protein HanRHA438_Chr06g0259751 [Helianthus annuus]|uniref:Uncharacterized protein n=1 Tax=Helianthus annuus TaxID=4232 RepID=A0A251UGS5_HELAN|nr:hypothetical protein HanXRQr2_Chr06g0250461 [Helianthus annuus]KAJ0566057.1 hypothetical protein HanIR_Chr06g0269561 [Helianthus annuus]KAJ0911116.1 hypothetical protein HanRHA438_Chr06g0259751 [Helianthus annuus]
MEDGRASRQSSSTTYATMVLRRHAVNIYLIALLNGGTRCLLLIHAGWKSEQSFPQMVHSIYMEVARMAL